MKAAILALLVTTAALTALAALPAAQAHVCNGPAKECGNCVKGEEHVHSDGEGSNCVSDASQLIENNYKRSVPATAAPLALVGLAFVALLARR